MAKLVEGMAVLTERTHVTQYVSGGPNSLAEFEASQQNATPVSFLVGEHRLHLVVVMIRSRDEKNASFSARMAYGLNLPFIVHEYDVVEGRGKVDVPIELLSLI